MIDKKLYCMTHPLSVCGRDLDGKIFQRCYQGMKNYNNGVDMKCDIRDAKDHTADHQVLEDGSCVVCEFRPGDIKTLIQ